MTSTGPDPLAGVDLRPGGLGALGSWVASRWPGRQHVGVLVDAHVASLWPLPAWPAGWTVHRHDLPRGEAAKTREAVALAQDALLDVPRDGGVVVIGGGATTDAGGYVAATLRRGLPWLAVPTTVVGMVDAAHGGKVGINHPRGKNLLGTFHVPDAVLVDVDVLGTLPPRDVAAGLAEVHKAGWVDPSAGVRDALRQVDATSPRTLAPCIHAAVSVKQALVAEDPRDLGVRRLLNFGHTAGHALETVLGNDALRHGEAVAIGMTVAVALAAARGRVPSDALDTLEEDLQALGLPIHVPATASETELVAALALDKKRGAGSLHTWVLPGSRGLEVVTDVTDAEVRAALEARRAP